MIMDREALDSGKDSERNKRGRRNWTPEQRKLYRAWHNYYLTLAYARNDPKTFYVAIDHAARMAGMNQCGFYNRYLLSGEPVKRTCGGRCSTWSSTALGAIARVGLSDDFT